MRTQAQLALNEDEERGILAALEELDSGMGIPLADVMREIRSNALLKNPLSFP